MAPSSFDNVGSCLVECGTAFAPLLDMRQHIRRRRRGVTLIEVLVVLAIISMIAAGVGLAVYQHYREAQIRMAEANARTVREGVKAWWLTGEGSACPTFDVLVESRALDEDAPPDDPWGTPWRIECDRDRVSVGSSGPDRRAHTDDDIRVPPLVRQNGDSAV